MIRALVRLLAALCRDVGCAGKCSTWNIFLAAARWRAVVAVRHCGAELSSSLERRSGSGNRRLRGATFFRGKLCNSAVGQRNVLIYQTAAAIAIVEGARKSAAAEVARRPQRRSRGENVPRGTFSSSRQLEAPCQIRSAGQSGAKVRGAPEHPRSAVPFRIECSTTILRDVGHRQCSTWNISGRVTIAAMRTTAQKKRPQRKNVPRGTFSWLTQHCAIDPNGGIESSGSHQPDPPLLIREQELSNRPESGCST